MICHDHPFGVSWAAQPAKEADVLTEKEARKLSGAIQRSLGDLENNLKAFHAGMGYLALGYESFTEWWDAELGPVPISVGLRNWAIFKMVEEQPLQRNGKKKWGSVVAVADAVGLEPGTIHTMMQKRHQRKTGFLPDEPVNIGFVVPNKWRDRIIKDAQARNMNMSDLVRNCLKRGFKQFYGVDLDAPEELVRK
jgi:hypothetical protein